MKVLPKRLPIVKGGRKVRILIQTKPSYVSNWKSTLTIRGLLQKGETGKLLHEKIYKYLIKNK